MTNKLPVIAAFPAFDIVDDKAREFHSGDKIAIPFPTALYGDLYSIFTLGDVAAYARKYGEDEVAAVARAIERGHTIFWANPDGVCLTAEKQAHRTYPGFKFGDVLRYDGKRFEIKPDFNNNVKLVEMPA